MCKADIRSYLFILSCITALCLCSYNKTEEGVAPMDMIPTVVMQIQRCSKLYTTEVHVHKIVTHDDQLRLDGSFMKKGFGINPPLGRQKIAILMDVTLRVYIDFSDLSGKSTQRRGRKIEIILSDPRVTPTSTHINHEKVEQYIILTRNNFSDGELANHGQQGRDAIIHDINSPNIIDMARESAAHMLIPIIEQMGYREEDITILSRK